MDDMRKRRRSQKTRVRLSSRMTKSLRTDVERKATEEENQEKEEDVEVEEEEEEEDEDAEDEEEESQGRCDIRQPKTGVRCPARLDEPGEARKRSMYFKDHSSPTRRRCLPMNLLKDDLLGVHKDRMKIGARLADVDSMHIDKTVQELFRMEWGEVFHVKVPTSRERRNFFEDLLLNQAAKGPASEEKAGIGALEVLPVAAPPPPRQLTEEETWELEDQEEDTLRVLRLFLRDVTNRLSQDKRFKAFTKPVDLEEVPDYTEVIKKPMDLSTVLSNIDRHQYGTVKEFLQDVDLIWQNALDYNPDKDPTDHQIRHKACALKDTVHAIIKDELDEDFEKICVKNKASRSTRVLPKQSQSPAEANLTPQREPVRPKAAVTPNTRRCAATTSKHTEKSARRVTRGLKSAVLLQQVVDMDRALQILHLETPPLVVDGDKLKELLKRVVVKTEGFEVDQLEKLYALLCQSIYRHRRDYNKTSLIQELKQEIEDFC